MFLSSGTGKELFQQVAKARKRERRVHNHVETMRCHLTPVRMVTISLKKNKNKIWLALHIRRFVNCRFNQPHMDSVPAWLNPCILESHA